MPEQTTDFNGVGKIPARNCNFHEDLMHFTSLHLTISYIIFIQVPCCFSVLSNDSDRACYAFTNVHAMQEHPWAKRHSDTHFSRDTYLITMWLVQVSRQVDMLQENGRNRRFWRGTTILVLHSSAWSSACFPDSAQSQISLALCSFRRRRWRRLAWDLSPNHTASLHSFSCGFSYVRHVICVMVIVWWPYCMYCRICVLMHVQHAMYEVHVLFVCPACNVCMQCATVMYCMSVLYVQCIYATYVV